MGLLAAIQSRPKLKAPDSSLENVGKTSSTVTAAATKTEAAKMPAGEDVSGEKENNRALGNIGKVYVVFICLQLSSYRSHPFASYFLRDLECVHHSSLSVFTETTTITNNSSSCKPISSAFKAAPSTASIVGAGMLMGGPASALKMGLMDAIRKRGAQK